MASSLMAGRSDEARSERLGIARRMERVGGHWSTLMPRDGSRGLPARVTFGLASIVGAFRASVSARPYPRHVPLLE